MISFMAVEDVVSIHIYEDGLEAANTRRSDTAFLELWRCGPTVTSPIFADLMTPSL